jgi:hypothetical protein
LRVVLWKGGKMALEDDLKEFEKWMDSTIEELAPDLQAKLRAGKAVLREVARECGPNPTLLDVIARLDDCVFISERGPRVIH